MVILKILLQSYGLVLIGHSRDKIIKEKDGTEYNFLSCSLTNDYTDIFLDSADSCVIKNNNVSYKIS